MSETPVSSTCFSRRCAGVLLHPTSLPNTESCWKSSAGNIIGTLGKDAYKFVDFLEAAGVGVWQMLPIGPTQADLSPYQSISAHAGSPDLISLDWLVENNWVASADVEMTEPSREGLSRARRRCAETFHKRIAQQEWTDLAQEYSEFCAEQSFWLDDYVVFSAIRNHYKNLPWVDWPKELRNRDPIALAAIKKLLVDTISFYLFEQFAFFSQWKKLRSYAENKGVKLFGDMPIFVGHDSADVWAQPHYFQLDPNGQPLTVAGVPPDYFSETGQHWGNPHYAWDVMQADGFQWWLARIKTQLMLFDFIRIDHFRGFEAYWEIPGGSKDARAGRWVKAPGEALLTACFNAFPNLPLVAENLGVITEEVEALRAQFELPGMLVLQFAFDGNTDNPHLPHNHTRHDVIYTGTHDNDTTLGWWDQLNERSREQVKSYTFESTESMPWLLMSLALASVGRMAIIPMQHLLALGNEHRMNMPGTTNNNWMWTFSWDQIEPQLANSVRALLTKYHRLKE